MVDYAAQLINFINRMGQDGLQRHQDFVRIAFLDAISALIKTIVPAVAQDGNLREIGAPHVHQAAKLVPMKKLVPHVLTL